MLAQGLPTWTSISLFEKEEKLYLAMELLRGLNKIYNLGSGEYHIVDSRI